MTTKATVLAAEEDLGSMPLFGVAHFSALAVTVVMTAVLLGVVRRYRGSRAVDRAITIAGWLMLLVGAGWILWDLMPGRFDPAQAIPADLSDWARIIIPVALITRAGWAVAVAYLWGLSLNLMALVTPDLNYSFSPPVEYGMFWFSHVAAFIAPVVLVWGLGLRPTWRGFGFTFVFTVFWAAVASVVNLIAGANYGYLRHAPPEGSPLDLMGPWPVYIGVAAAVVAVVWALFTWPWTAERLTRGTEPVGAGFIRRPAGRNRPDA